METIPRYRWLYYFDVKASLVFALRSIESYGKLLGNGLNGNTASSIRYAIERERAQLPFWKERLLVCQAYLGGMINEESYLYCLDHMTASHQKDRLWLNPTTPPS